MTLASPEPSEKSVTSAQSSFALPTDSARRTNANPPPILTRRASFPTAYPRFFSRQFRRFARHSPVDPSIPTIHEDEGAPAPRGARVEANAQTIRRTILPRKPSGQITFPEFDGLEAYLVPGLEETAAKLWDDEINRLLDVVQHPERPLKFSNAAFVGKEGEQGYRDLSNLAQKIMTAMSICMLDNESIVVQHCSLLSSRERLKKLMAQVNMSLNAGEGGDVGGANVALQATNALIDYISSVLARLITQTATGGYWQNNVLGVLVKRVVKMKVLLKDMHANGFTAISNGEAVFDSTRNTGGFDMSSLEDEEECEELLRMLNANTKEGLATAEEAELTQYCANQTKFRSGINATLRYILLSLRFLDRSGLPATAYEICAVVYETGFEGFKVGSFPMPAPNAMLTRLILQALLFQDRDLEYSATSDLDTLNTAHSAFSILNHTVVNLGLEKGNSGEYKTSIEWCYKESENSSCVPCETAGDLEVMDLSGHGRQTLSLDSMEEIITVMVPLVITSPVFVSNFTSFKTMMALSSNVKDIVRPYAESQFSAFFRMHTSDFGINAARRKDVLGLSQAVDHGLFSRCSLMSMTGPDARPGGAKQLRKLTELTWEMDSWVIDENSVTVHCGLYVWTVIFAALILGGGGLAVAFSVGNRIEGVDPSNMATYTWALAAFLVLVCKSLLVSNWAWSDFLHRRVRCRSLSELHAVTGINEQLIVAKLLHDEGGHSILKVRGPYNSVFLNKSADGFSIDCPPDLRTLLLSGLTPLKVITPRGYALVFLDGRRGTELAVVEHHGTESKAHLVCEDFSRVAQRTERRRPHHAIRLPLTHSKNLKWKMVQGIYNVMDAVLV